MRAGEILGQAGLDGGVRGFPFSTATEEGRRRNREVVDEYVRLGLATRPPEAPPEPPTPKSAFRSRPGARRDCHTEGRMVEAGRRLTEPFNRADLARAAKIEPGKASNVMSDWRRAGWIVSPGGPREWVRTSRFGEGAS